MTERRWPACAQTHVVLRRDERVTDIHDAVPVHVAAHNYTSPCQTWRGKVDERGDTERQSGQVAQWKQRPRHVPRSPLNRHRPTDKRWRSRNSAAEASPHGQSPPAATVQQA